MKRAIIKWWISRSIDQSVELTSWLRSQIERDRELQRFEQDARRLARGLQQEARAWLTDRQADEHQTSRSHVVRPDRISALPYGVSLAATAAVLLFIMWLPWPSAPHPRHESTIAAGDAMALLAFLDAGEAVIRPWQQVPHLAASWPEPTWDIPGVSHATVAAERSAQRVCGDIKSSLDLGKRQAVSDLKSACHFFSRTLPSNAARLIVP